MEDDEGAPPFWSRPGGSFRRSRRRGSSAAAIGSGVMVVLLLAAALALVFIVVPSVLSAISRIFRPNVVKRSWDSLNLVLVLFAILCGLLSRNTVSEESSYGESRSFKSRASLESDPSTPGDRRFGYSDQAAYGRRPSLNRLRSSSSYPDLRQEPMSAKGDDRRRYFDDTNICRPRRWRDDDEVGNGNGGSGYGGTAEIKTIQVDRLEVQEKKVSVSQTPLPEPTPPPPQSASPLKQALETSPPPPSSTSSTRPRAANRRSRRNKEALVETHALMHEPKTEDNRVIETYKLPPPPPPPPPPPVFDYYATPNKSDKNVKKRGGSGTRDFIRSLGRRRKRQRQKSVENFDSLLHSSFQPQPCLPPPSHPPPPPPLPPPPSVFENLFSSKRGKSKKDCPPPPPPPPPSRATKASLEAATSQPRPKPSAAAGRAGPANPVRHSASVYPANTSPLIPIPPPPPPPFKVPDWKFSMRGGYVRIRSSSSSSSTASRGSSPDLMEEKQSPPREETVHVSDVDTKADNFIARFRAGLHIERMNSLKQRARSNLGRDPNAGPDL